MLFKLFDADQLHRSMPAAGPITIRTYIQALNDQMDAAAIDTKLRMAHFLAQIGHESGDLFYMEEIATGSAYEGRKDLGNVYAGDGVRFKGRGPIQVTGRANYLAYGTARGKGAFYTIEPNNHLLASDPATAIDSACWFWTSHNLNALADADDILTITHRINGGTNGYADRCARLARAKTALEQSPAVHSA
jgi:putative chitinase